MSSWLPVFAVVITASLPALTLAQPTPADSAQRAITAVAPAPPAAPAPPPSPVSSMRNKISAGDLLSAESILEVHRAKNGEDPGYLTGLSWLARGALLLGETDKAKSYTAQVRSRVAERLAKGDTLDKHSDLEIALGAAIEVEAQLIQRSKGSKAATSFVRSEVAKIPGPPALRARLHKRINLMELAGNPAPELVIEDHLGGAAPSLATLRGKPVLMFLWAEWCSDCKAQASLLSGARARHAKDGLEVVAVTRFYDTDHAKEKARVDSVWTAAYSEVGAIPTVFSTASMERYGASSTPTFVFIDRGGVVRDYTPTRLTEAALEERLTKLMR